MTKKTKQPSLTVEQIKKALIKSNGLQWPAAKMLGVTQGNISQRIKRSKELQTCMNDIIEKMLDHSENTLHEKIVNEKNLTASIFYLKCKGKHRGYSEKHETELTTPEGANLNFRVEFVDSTTDTEET